MIKESSVRGSSHSECSHVQQGFTLLEVMVALVVLSIGLLGVAKLVVGAVHANDSGYMRGQATQLAYEMLDEMRANRPGAIAGNYVTGPGALTDCTVASCNAAALAGLDVYDWDQRLAQTLPSGKGAVVTAAGIGGTIATITVTWDDSQAQWAFGTSPTTVPGAMAVTLESVL
jgi:type IV pilus assembly protein PilV